MKRFILLSLMALLALTLFGCGDSHPQPQLFSQQILSDPMVDGDIENTSPPTVRHLPSLIASFDPVTFAESRAFVHFPLSTIPLNGIINSATLTFFVRAVSTRAPLSIDLVSFAEPLIGPDFGLPIIKTIRVTPDIGLGDVNHDVTVDITSLMAEAQLRGLLALQLRLVVENPGGFVEIDDTNAAPPQLDVTYY